MSIPNNKPSERIPIECEKNFKINLLEHKLRRYEG